MTAHKRETVDTSLIALCYWLMAQRLVEEAETHGEFDCPDPTAHASHAAHSDNGAVTDPAPQAGADR
jgi:hypothetical protein